MSTWKLLRAVGVLALVGPTFAGHGATFVVTNTADAGAGSLRQAILSANSTPGLNTIQFNIPAPGVQTIAPLTMLPDVTNRVVIDGYSQPGSSPNTLANGNNAVLLIRLDGLSLSNNLAPLLKLNGVSGCTVRGLIIVRCFSGLQLYASSGDTIAGNWIGVDFDDLARGGTGNGVDVTCAVFNYSSNNLIGGTAPAARNVIGGFWAGISFFPGTAGSNTVQGNYIGVDLSGSLPRGNQFNGIKIQGPPGIQIGGTAPGAGNVIGGSGSGVSILGANATIIQDNLIGTDPSRRYYLGNSGDGISLQSCAYTTISGNVIVNNAKNGINFLGCSTNTVKGNWIGTDPTALQVMGNGAAGVLLQNSSYNTLGGASTGAGNTIEFNSTAGVSISTGGNDTISANSIYDNGGPGINLTSGGNQSQASPVITNVTTAYGYTEVQGTLSSLPGAGFALEFFATPQWDGSGTPEGKIYLGSTGVSTDGSGFSAFGATFASPVPTNMVITATATDAQGNTSAFSSGLADAYGPARVILGMKASGGVLTLSWPSVSGFQLQTTPSLLPASWQTILTGVFDDGVTRSCSITNAPGAGSAFFRLAH